MKSILCSLLLFPLVCHGALRGTGYNTDTFVSDPTNVNYRADTFNASTGIVTRPSITFMVRTNTGFYTSTAFDGIYASVAGVARLVLDSSGISAGSNIRFGSAATSADIAAHRVSLAALSISNAIAGSTRYFIGGTLTNLTTPIASAGASETNLQSWSVTAHTLTNAMDGIRFRASGNFAATANAKQIKVVFGSQTVFDSGSQVQNGGAWVIEGTISRTGSTAQTADATLTGHTNALFTTASAVSLVQTNGIATVLKLTGTASGNGDLTNRTLRVYYEPAL